MEDGLFADNPVIFHFCIVLTILGRQRVGLLTHHCKLVSLLIAVYFFGPFEKSNKYTIRLHQTFTWCFNVIFNQLKSTNLNNSNDYNFIFRIPCTCWMFLWLQQGDKHAFLWPVNLGNGYLQFYIFSLFTDLYMRFTKRRSFRSESTRIQEIHDDMHRRRGLVKLLFNKNLAHLIGDRLIPEQLLWVDCGVLHVGPTKSLTF